MRKAIWSSLRTSEWTQTTNVTWAMYTPTYLHFEGNANILSMDSMVSKDFETGLVNLKTIAEK